MKISRIIPLLYTSALLTVVGIKSADDYNWNKSRQEAVQNVTVVHGERPFRRASFYSGFDDSKDGNIDRIVERSTVFWYRSVAPIVREYTPKDQQFTGLVSKLNNMESN